MTAIVKTDWVKGVAHWRDGETAFISVAFTWRLPEARRLTEYYRAIGCTKIRIGGPGTFTMRKYLTDLGAEIGGSIHLWRKTKFKDYDPNARTAPRLAA